MDIKTLVDYTKKIKTLRNGLELLTYDLREEIEHEADNRNRSGLSYQAESKAINDAVGKLEWSLEYLNNGVAFLETAYRRSVRVNEIKEEPKKSEDTK